MATRNSDYGKSAYPEEMAPAQSPRLTSVNAHTSLSIVVSLSVIEMETLIQTFGVADSLLDEKDRILQREFADAVRALRLWRMSYSTVTNSIGQKRPTTKALRNTGIC